MMGLVNREGVETTAAFGVAMQLWTYIQMPAMALGAAVERDGGAEYRRRPLGAGGRDHPARHPLQSDHHRRVRGGLLAIADRPALALFLGGDSPALPIARHIQLLATWSFLLFGVTMVLFGTVRANGAVIGPLIILAIGLFPGPARLRARRCIRGSAPTLCG